MPEYDEQEQPQDTGYDASPAVESYDPPPAVESYDPSPPAESDGIMPDEIDLPDFTENQGDDIDPDLGDPTDDMAPDTFGFDPTAGMENGDTAEESTESYGLDPSTLIDGAPEEEEDKGIIDSVKDAVSDFKEKQSEEREHEKAQRAANKAMEYQGAAQEPAYSARGGRGKIRY